jgi:hypothetical protein
MKKTLGTVSFRDFSNREEVGVPSYFDVISVIDHHKSELMTRAPSIAILGDVQSSNSLVALKSFEMNDRFSTGGQTGDELERQIADLLAQKLTSKTERLLERLWIKKRSRKGPYFIAPERELLEYYHYLFAIIDDTDLLSKATFLDVEVVVSLLNRLKSLQTRREEEILCLDDIPRGDGFVQKAASRILQNEEMYSLYRRAYVVREEQMEKALQEAALGRESLLFSDTKEQNGCCRVGQTKLFSSNVDTFQKCRLKIQKGWVAASKDIYEAHETIDLFIHMISTVVGANEVYTGKKGVFDHCDELWIWVPAQSEVALGHLKQFLNGFRGCPGLQEGLKGDLVSITALEREPTLLGLAEESFGGGPPYRVEAAGIPMLVVRYPAGALNSRKAMISPFLPRAPQ